MLLKEYFTTFVELFFNHILETLNSNHHIATGFTVYGHHEDGEIINLNKSAATQEHERVHQAVYKRGYEKGYDLGYMFLEEGFAYVAGDFVKFNRNLSKMEDMAKISEMMFPFLNQAFTNIQNSGLTQLQIKN